MNIDKEIENTVTQIFFLTGTLKTLLAQRAEENNNSQIKELNRYWSELSDRGRESVLIAAQAAKRVDDNELKAQFHVIKSGLMEAGAAKRAEN